MGNLLAPEALKTNDQRWRNQTSLSVRPKGDPLRAFPQCPQRKGRKRKRKEKKKQKTTKKVKFPFNRERSEPVNYTRSPNGRTLSVPAFPCSIMGQIDPEARAGAHGGETRKRKRKKNFLSPPTSSPFPLLPRKKFFFFSGSFSFPSLCLGQKRKEERKKKICQKNSFFLLRCEKEKKKKRMITDGAQKEKEKKRKTKSVGPFRLARTNLQIGSSK